jgi:IMP cyclohydrolase
MAGLEVIADKEYLGRMIILGQLNSGEEIVAYAVTGRSDSSRARRLLVNDNNVISTEPTDPAALKKGNPALLIYDCIVPKEGNIAVSNGRQTGLLVRPEHSPRKLLLRAFAADSSADKIDVTSYEPDAPNFTPRISGVLTRDGAGLSIIKKYGGGIAQTIYDFPLEPGMGQMIATYTGKNVPSGTRIPPFSGDPWDVELPFESVDQVANNIYSALGPKTGPEILSPDQDFRVGVAVLLHNRATGDIKTKIINRHEEKQ